jgi:hypothetical protein
MESPYVDGESSQTAGITTHSRAFVMLTILALGQAQIKQGKFSEIGEVFMELDELDRKERNRCWARR